MSHAESIVLAIAALNDFHNPESHAFKLKNPMLLRSFAPDSRHSVDGDGVRVYKSAFSGLKSCVVDIDVKLSGKSVTGLRPDQTLQNLLKILGVKTKEQQAFIVRFLREAIGDKNISLATPLRFFYEGK